MSARPQLPTTILTTKGGGFTLIEVIVTLTIFIILTASVFGIMTAVFESSNGLKTNQNRQDQLSALRSLLKNHLGGLAVGDHFQSYRRGNGDGLRVNGVLLITAARAEAFDASPQANGLYRLRLAQDLEEGPTSATFAQKLDKNVSALTWVELISDVRLITWKFQSLFPNWVPDWANDSKPPTVVECSIQPAGDDKPTVMDFSIPHLVPSPSQTAAPDKGG